MSTRTNGVICWYCDSFIDEPCEACDEVNAILAVLPEGVLIEQLAATWRAVWSINLDMATDDQRYEYEQLRAVRP